ncbi:MAG: RnfABCDGE type electron transport complex subunit D [Spirochaetaceae bacterium]|jgi:electron transport complex protein RnfD|nr:RnfABCDGE type electron transport complex subunit D [Spirochaetaceae bacterium]
MDISLFQKPQVNLARSTRGRMWLVSVCAFLAVFQSSLGDNFHSLFIALAAVAGAMGTELLFNIKARYYSIKDGSALASALVLALLLPNRLNPLLAFLGGVFAMAVVKHSFGGLGSNWVNPAAGAWLFIRSAWPGGFARSVEQGHLEQLASSLEMGLRDSQGLPMALLKINGWPSSSLDTVLSAFFNNTVFAFTGTSLPQGYITLLSPPGPGIIADRGLFLLLLGTILIVSSQSFRFWLPLVFVSVFSFLVRIFGALSFGGPLWEGDVLFVLLSGGTMAVAFILITDPATGPKSAPGYVIFVVFVALFAFLFRYPGRDPYGAITAVLAGNALTPLIRRIENFLYYEKRRREA